MIIDWARMAKPQDDGYDSDVLATLLFEKYGWVKRQNEGSFIGGRVQVAKDPLDTKGDYMTDAFDDVKPAELAAVDYKLSAWPAGYRWLGSFLDEYWPKRMLDKDGKPHRGRGSCSGHNELGSLNKVPLVFVTVNDPQGCAEGIYHEAAHLRLEVLGMHISQHDGSLITNTPEELYDSPVRKDCKRPMCAVVHGLYAWMMLTENDLWCAQSCMESIFYLEVNIPKIAEGIGEVEQHVRTTPEGSVFIASLLDWAKDIVVRGNAIIDAKGAS